MWFTINLIKLAIWAFFSTVQIIFIQKWIYCLLVLHTTDDNPKQISILISLKYHTFILLCNMNVAHSCQCRKIYSTNNDFIIVIFTRHAVWDSQCSLSTARVIIYLVASVRPFIRISSHSCLCVYNQWAYADNWADAVDRLSICQT